MPFLHLGYHIGFGCRKKGKIFYDMVSIIRMLSALPIIFVILACCLLSFVLLFSLLLLNFSFIALFLLNPRSYYLLNLDVSFRHIYFFALFIKSLIDFGRDFNKKKSPIPHPLLHFLHHNINLFILYLEDFTIKLGNIVSNSFYWCLDYKEKLCRGSFGQHSSYEPSHKLIGKVIKEDNRV